MKRLINRRVIFFLFIALILGIVFSVYSRVLCYIFAVCLCIFSAGGFILSLKRLKNVAAGKFAATVMRRLRRDKLLALILLIALLTGFAAGALSLSSRRESSIEMSSGRLTGRVALVSSTDKLTELYVENGEFFLLGRSVKLSGRTRVRVFGDDVKIRIGDTVELHGELFSPDLMQGGQLDGFLYSENIRYRMDANVEQLKVFSGQPSFFEGLRLSVRAAIERNMSPRGASLCYGMLAGDTSSIDDEDIQAFRVAGVAHVFAVSGLHVGILSGALLFLLKKCRLPAAVRMPAVIAALIFYNLFCGYSPSVLRASVMFGMLLLSRSLGTKYDDLTSLCLSGIVNLAIAPLSLFDASFMLSYAALLGILFLASPLSRALSVLPRRLKSPLSVSFAAQLGTMPVSIFFFDCVSLVGLWFNTLFLPVIGGLFLLFVGALLITLVVPPLGVVLYAFGAAFGFLAELTVAVASLPFSQIFLYSFGIVTAGFYVLYFFLSDFFLAKKRVKSVVCLCLCAALLSGVLATELPLPPRENRLIVFSGEREKTSLVEFSNGKRLLLLSEPTVASEATLYLKKNRIRRIDSVVFLYTDNSILTSLQSLCEAVRFDRVILPFCGDKESEELFRHVGIFSEQNHIVFTAVSNSSFLVGDQRVGAFTSAYRLENASGTAVVSGAYITALHFDFAGGLLFLSNLNQTRVNAVLNVFRGVKVGTVKSDRFTELIGYQLSPDRIIAQSVIPFPSDTRLESTRVKGAITAKF